MSDHVAAAARTGTETQSSTKNGSTSPSGLRASGQASELAQRAVARGVGEGRALLHLTRKTLDAPIDDNRSLRSWLVRASFMLFAVALIMVTVLSAIGLLNTAETMVILGPVLALAGVVVGATLGSSGS